MNDCDIELGIIKEGGTFMQCLSSNIINAENANTYLRADVRMTSSSSHSGPVFLASVWFDLTYNETVCAMLIVLHMFPYSPKS